jgi:flagellum-specific ATP synthase
VGRICRISGTTLESDGPEARMGEMCLIRARAGESALRAEVIGFANGKLLLMPYGDVRGIAPDSEIEWHAGAHAAGVGDSLLGRVVDAFGEPLDGLPPPAVSEHRELQPMPLSPLERAVRYEPFLTGVRALDVLLPLARGQRIGIFAGSGVGKSTLLGMMARHAEADVLVVALIGERGREVRAFLEEALPAQARARAVVVVATSDQPALVRRRAAFLATAIAEYFAETGRHACLMLDSVTRIAMAQREIGLAGGELPTARGYTPSVYALLPRLLERGGTREGGGALTALYTVLVEGDDLLEPLTDQVRAILDGHVVLSRAIAQRARYPAIDVPQSISRLAPKLWSNRERELVAAAVKALATYEQSRDLIEVGAYRAGANVGTDHAIRVYEATEAFLSQPPEERADRAASFDRLAQLLSAAKVPAPLAVTPVSTSGAGVAAITAATKGRT